jgi:hypothetical protein
VHEVVVIAVEIDRVVAPDAAVEAHDIRDVSLDEPSDVPVSSGGDSHRSRPK